MCVPPQTLPGLVERIEAGDLDGSQTRRILRDAVLPLVAQGADTLVLACTHYPLVIPAIAMIARPGVQVVDPSLAIARQARRLLEERGLRSIDDYQGQVTFITSGNPRRLREMALRLIAEDAPAGQAIWDTAGRTLRLAEDQQDR